MFRSRFDPPISFEPSYRSPVTRLLLFALVIGLSTGLAIYGFNVGQDVAQRLPMSSLKSQKIEYDIEALKIELGTIKNRVSTKLPEGEYKAEILQLRSDLERIDSNLSRIGAAILTDPAKALEVPLIQRDLEAMKQNQAQALLVVQQDISRLYAITGGGIVFLLSISIPLVVGRLSSRADRSGAATEDS